MKKNQKLAAKNVRRARGAGLRIQSHLKAGGVTQKGREDKIMGP
jgi:hypothetical protein